MDYEKNKEALEIVRQMVSDGQVAQDVAEKYFPELIESENERMRKDIISFLNGSRPFEPTMGERFEMVSWLKKQKPVEWSEEDEKIIKRIISNIEQLKGYCKYDLGKDLYNEEIDWLKSLSPQSRWKPSEQEKAALRTAIQVMTKERSFPLLGAHLQNILDAFEGESRVDWKPSKGQMEALKEACYLHYDPKGELYSLYEQLKAL